jgi:hypothetical protein
VITSTYLDLGQVVIFYDITGFLRHGFFADYLNLYLGDIWFLPADICKKQLKSQPQHIEYRNQTAKKHRGGHKNAMPRMPV